MENIRNVIWQDTFDGGSDHRKVPVCTITQRNDVDMDRDFKWIWTHDPSFRVAEISTLTLDPTAICLLGTPKACPLIQAKCLLSLQAAE
jgi:hypothetical protein